MRSKAGNTACPLFLAVLTCLPLPSHAEDGQTDAHFAREVLTSEIFTSEYSTGNQGIATNLLSEGFLANAIRQEPRKAEQPRIQLSAAQSTSKTSSSRSPSQSSSEAVGSTPNVAQSDGALAVHDQQGLWYQQPDSPEPLDLGAIVFRLVLGSVAVLAACVVSLWAARRWLKNGSVLGTGSGRMQLIESLALANRCSVQLIQVDNRKLLIGLDTSGLKTILPLADEFASTLDEIKDEGTNSASSLQSREPLNRPIVVGAAP
ncbi:MAG: flagellar biosynthetic protein FliO [Gammaproteobacteria bacterium]|nr:flagellar biosynthetic protein FliO [Gammaproteobacteria bacterium]